MRTSGLLLALLALLAPLALPRAAPGEELLDGIAAQVGSEIVLVSEVRRLTEPAERELRRKGLRERDLEALRSQALERLIERALVRQVVKRAEMGATEQEVTQAMQDIARQNGLSLEELRQNVTSQGMPFEVYRERIRGEIERAKVINSMVGSRVDVTDEEVRELYEQRYGDQPQGGTGYRLRHILVPFTSDGAAAREEACARVERALERIRGGEPFPRVAREVSAVAADSGGDIGRFHSDELASWMRPAVEGLARGETSDVLRTDFGCNLLQVAEKSRHEPKELEQVRSELEQQVYQRKLKKEFADFLERIRERTYIDRKGLYADAAPPGGGAPAPEPDLPDTVIEDDGF